MEEPGEQLAEEVPATSGNTPPWLAEEPVDWRSETTANQSEERPVLAGLPLDGAAAGEAETAEGRREPTGQLRDEVGSPAREPPAGLTAEGLRDANRRHNLDISLLARHIGRIFG